MSDGEDDTPAEDAAGDATDSGADATDPDTEDVPEGDTPADADPESDSEETASGNGSAAEAESEEAGEADAEEGAIEPADAAPPTTPEEFDDRLDDLEEALEGAETEADLDAIEADLDAVADALEDADLPEPDEDDEDAEDPRADIEGRLEELRDRLEDQRGPYAEDAVAALEDATGTITDTRWTEDGIGDVRAAVDELLGAVGTALDADLEPPGEDADAETVAGTLEAPAAAIEAAALDPDADAETIAALIEATDALADALEAAEEWDDLTTTEQLEAEGFFEVLEHRKDYPPEWHALKLWERRGNAEMVLLALEKLQSEFMEEHCLDALERMGPQAAYDPMIQRAGRRDKAAIAILGKIGDERALDTILEFVDADSDPALQKVTLRAIGEIGSEEATQAVANKLVSDNETIRSRAARTLGLIGDPRAIDPLEEVLATDGSDQVRASAAWALARIGTQPALEIAAEYTDDRSYLVQAEAERAATALETAPPA